MPPSPFWVGVFAVPCEIPVMSSASESVCEVK